MKDSLLFISGVCGLNIYSYDSPLVTIDHGHGWILNGHFSLVHVIDLNYFNTALEKLRESTRYEIENEAVRTVLQFHLNQTQLRLEELQMTKLRKTRSIDWIGSAWKWIAGSPDAADWDYILRSLNEVVNNNNHQYRVNEKLFNGTREAIEKANEMMVHVNAISKSVKEENLELLDLSKVLILKEQVSEVVQACQMAKTGIVNTNLLDREEIHRLILEEESLPYQNVIEAIEHGSASVYSNGTLLLYVLSMPKVKPDSYRLLMTRAAIINGQHIVLDYEKMLINQDETFGINNDCPSIGNYSICAPKSLTKLPEDACIARLLKGGNAKCHFEPSNSIIIEMIDETSLFLTNFWGKIQGKNYENVLNGTYVILLNNETIVVGNQTFTSRSTRVVQALPPALTNVTSNGLKLNLDYIHELSVTNIRHLRKLGETFHFSLIIDTVALTILASICYVIWRKVNTTIYFPRLNHSINQDQLNAHFKDLRQELPHQRDADV